MRYSGWEIKRKVSLSGNWSASPVWLDRAGEQKESKSMAGHLEWALFLLHFTSVTAKLSASLFR